jgi:hypothetical protein
MVCVLFLKGDCYEAFFVGKLDACGGDVACVRSRMHDGPVL